MTAEFASVHLASLGAVLLGLIAAAPAPAPAQDDGDATVIHCGKLLDVEAREVLVDQRVLVVDDRIAAIGPRVDAPAGAESVDLSSHTCMPGLMDMHVHLFIDLTGRTLDEAAPTQSSAYNALMGLRNAQKLLSIGFTTIRVPGDMDYHYANVELRDAIERGWYQGPRMKVAPHTISPLGGHGDFNSYAPDLPHEVTGPFIADGVDEVRRAVRREIKYGADWIKVMASGGVMSQHDDPEVAAYTAEEFRAFAEETHRHGKKITAHAHGDAGIRAAVEAGFDSIEHGTMMEAETARLMAEKGTYYVPTLYVLDWILERGATGGITADNLAKAELVTARHSDSVKMAAERGVNLIIGSDPIFPMEESIREFTSLARRVPDNWLVLRAGTINPARMLGLEGEIGTLAVGKQADIVASPGNPIDRMQNIENVTFVMKGGVIVRND
ncbi:MAG: amidohydrolase family protein [Holophagales bacterium]|nr:amidohydrolase family protein [Holophagales bacterium]MYD22791.1 amidohydrolase family protein [Holophagales bacterium]MYI32235.1 amidohydrolase family protein [Holophagales bacterium]